MSIGVGVMGIGYERMGVEYCGESVLGMNKNAILEHK